MNDAGKCTKISCFGRTKVSENELNVLNTLSQFADNQYILSF